MTFTRSLLAALLGLWLSAGTAAAVTLTFVQGGFGAGGEVRFTVTGTDLNGDNYLERENLNLIDEITGFSLSFSGNALVDPFVLALDELLVFGIDLADLDFLGPDAIIFAGNTSVAYLAGASAGANCVDIFLCGFVSDLDIDFASQPPLLVPEPGGLTLLALALAGLVAARRVC
jgi:hypothetical protein